MSLLTDYQVKAMLESQHELDVDGRFYWLVIHSKGDEWLSADEVKVTERGDLIFYNYFSQEFPGDTRVTYRLLPTSSFAKGTWERFYAANAITNEPVKVDKWDQ